MSRSLKFLIIFIMFFTVFFGLQTRVEAGGGNPPQVFVDTDGAGSYILVSFFDLRDRESFVQVTNTSSSSLTTHVQIFIVNDNCRENNFFDTYTGNDTHVYNMRDILTNDGAPSGVVLNDGEYGMVVVTSTASGFIERSADVLIGNFRIEDASGYEYRTNSAGSSRLAGATPNFTPFFSTFNFNTEGGVILSDLISIGLNDTNDGSPEVTADPIDRFTVFDINLYDLNEVPFSCRNIIAACIDQDSPRYEELLEAAPDAIGGASAAVAGFEYGINDAIPSSKGAPLTCPSNNISQGILTTNIIGGTEALVEDFFGVAFLGLNNGNGRGSMDSIWGENTFLLPPT